MHVIADPSRGLTGALVLLMALIVFTSVALASEEKVSVESVTPEQEARLAEIRASIEAAGVSWTAEHTTMSILPREEFLKRLGGG